MSTNSISTKNKKEAKRFLTALMTSKTLILNFTKELKVSIKKKNPDEYLNNYLTSLGYSCTIQEIRDVQLTDASYQLKYWIGIYNTTLKNNNGKKDGEVLTIDTQGDTQVVSYGDLFVIPTKDFQNLNLEWAKGDLNSTGGSITFNLMLANKTQKRSFFGQFTDSQGVNYNITGIITQKPKGKTPTDTNINVMDVISAVSDTIGIIVSFLTVIILVKELRAKKKEAEESKELSKDEKKEEIAKIEKKEEEVQAQIEEKSSLLDEDKNESLIKIKGESEESIKESMTEVIVVEDDPKIEDPGKFKIEKPSPEQEKMLENLGKDEGLDNSKPHEYGGDDSYNDMGGEISGE